MPGPRDLVIADTEPGVARVVIAPQTLEREASDEMTTLHCPTNSARVSDMNTRDQRITVRFTADMRQRLLETADRRGKRESDVIREAVVRELAADDLATTAYDRVKRAGLVGMVKGARRDLSTNREHFKGFGETRR